MIRLLIFMIIILKVISTLFWDKTILYRHIIKLWDKTILYRRIIKLYRENEKRDQKYLYMVSKIVECKN